jgi:hypothetical protein
MRIVPPECQKIQQIRMMKAPIFRSAAAVSLITLRATADFETGEL